MPFSAMFSLSTSLRPAQHWQLSESGNEINDTLDSLALEDVEVGVVAVVAPVVAVSRVVARVGTVGNLLNARDVHEKVTGRNNIPSGG